MDHGAKHSMEKEESTYLSGMNATNVEEKSAAFKLTWALLMLFSGTLTTLFAKGMFTTNSEGTQYCNMHDDVDKDCDFNKPWFSVFIMKLSMSLCLPLYYWFGWGREFPDSPNPSPATIKAVALPASLDLLNTILGNIGLLYVNSSIYQMTRGSVVIFSAILSVQYLGRTLRSFHYWAISMVMIAVVLVGTAGIEQGSDEDSDTGEVILGLCFILAAQAVTAVQFIAEESLMNNKINSLDPVALVGWEGVWGLCYFVVLAPILTLTPRSPLAISIVWHEDFVDTWVQACRVMGVWMVDLILWYVLGMKAIGEGWSEWSFMELAGFGVLMYGTFAYKGLVKLPWVKEDVYLQAELDAKELRDKEAESPDAVYNVLLNPSDNDLYI